MISILDAGSLGRLFVHFFDIHFIGSKLGTGVGSIQEKVLAEGRRATRLSVMFAEETVIPASVYIESALCQAVVDELEPLWDTGRLWLMASADSLQEFAEEKLRQYQRKSPQYARYRRVAKKGRVAPPIRRRRHSATRDIESAWMRSSDLTTIASIVNPLGDLTLSGAVLDCWREVPRTLRGLAFTGEYVSEQLRDAELPAVALARVNDYINREYFHSYARELGAGVVRDLQYLSAPYELASYGFDLPYRGVCRVLREMGLLAKVDDARAFDLLTLSKDGGVLASLDAATSASAAEARRLPQAIRRSKAVIVTALPQEFTAACTAFDAPPVPRARAAFLGTVVHAAGSVAEPIDACIVLLPRMGNNLAASSVASILAEVDAKYVIMCGIAGGVPDLVRAVRHVRLGDIVAPSDAGVVQHDFGKVSALGFEDRSAPRPPGADLVGAVMDVHARQSRGVCAWADTEEKVLRLLSDDWRRPDVSTDRLWVDGAEAAHPADARRVSGRSVFHVGVIASGNQVVKVAALRDEISHRTGCIAIEMEGAGVADAAWQRGVQYLVLRGACDYCDERKNDIWQPYAAVVAASMTRCIHDLLPR